MDLHVQLSVHLIYVFGVFVDGPFFFLKEFLPVTQSMMPPVLVVVNVTQAAQLGEEIASAFSLDSFEVAPCIDLSLSIWVFVNCSLVVQIVFLNDLGIDCVRISALL